MLYFPFRDVDASGGLERRLGSQKGNREEPIDTFNRLEIYYQHSTYLLLRGRELKSALNY